MKILFTHNLDDKYWVRVYNSDVLVADCINNTIIMHNGSDVMSEWTGN